MVWMVSRYLIVGVMLIARDQAVIPAGPCWKFVSVTVVTLDLKRVELTLKKLHLILKKEERVGFHGRE